MSLIIIGLLFDDERKELTNKIKNIFGSVERVELMEKKEVKIEQDSSLVYATLDENKIIDHDGIEITTSERILDYFYNTKLVVDGISYFSENDKIYKFENDKENNTKSNYNKLLNSNVKKNCIRNIIIIN